MSELYQNIERWSAEASCQLGELFDASRPYLEGKEGCLEESVRFISAQLYIDCHLSSESVLILISNLKEWDAELVNRSVIEGSVKYIYLIDGETEEQQRKANEYWNLMPDFMSIKRSERVKSLMQDIGDSDSLDWLPLKELLISDAEADNRRHGTNRQQRSKLEQDWSFSGIVQRYSKCEQTELCLMKHLAHGYGMSSHLIHKDGDGVGMAWERSQRKSQRQSAVKGAHLARIISDVCSLAKLRAVRLFKACEADVNLLKSIEIRYSSLEKELQTANSYFNQVEYVGEG